MSRKIGVSVICMIPWSLWQYGLGRAVMMAYDAGFDGLQILPMRGWNPFTFVSISKEQIISFELAWNCGSLTGAILRHLHLAGENNPLLHDWLLFGKCRATEYRTELLFRHFKKTSMFITHDVAHIGVMEMNPEMDLSADIYANYPHGLVWDTEHIVRPGRHGEPPVTDNWKKFLDKVSHNIKLIHVKSLADPKMLKALAEMTDCPVIFEDRPPFGQIFRPPLEKSKERMLAWLRSRRTFLGYFFD